MRGPQVLVQLRTALPISPLDTRARAARWPAIEKALSGLGIGPQTVGNLKAALLDLPGPLLQALDRTTAYVRVGGRAQWAWTLMHVAEHAAWCEPACCCSWRAGTSQSYRRASQLRASRGRTPLGEHFLH